MNVYSIHRRGRRRSFNVPAARPSAASLLFIVLAFAVGCGGGPPKAAPTAPPAPSTQPAPSRQSGPAAPPQAPTQTTPPTPAATAAGLLAGLSRLIDQRGAAAQAPPAPAQGKILERTLAETFSKAEIDDLEQRFFVYGNYLPAEYAVDWYHLRFTSQDRNGAPLQMVGQLFVPRAEGKEFPLYVFGPGTTGLKDECAPSHEEPTERNWGDFEAHLLSYAAQGYVAVMPDYAGNPATGLQYYYIAEMHARTMLDAARAGLRFSQDQPPPGTAKAANAVFFAGYSQGGHASYAARDFAASYAPELHVKGAIGYGPRGQVYTMLFEAPYLAPYLFYSYAQVYGSDKVPFRELLVPTVTRSLDEDMATKCIDEVPYYYGDYSPWILQPDLDDAVDHNRLDKEFPVLKQLMDSNDVGRAQSDIPVLILQGLSDTLVTPQTQQAFVQKLCSNGAKVTFDTYDGIPHVLTRQVSYRDVLAWMDAIQQGRPPRVDCGR